MWISVITTTYNCAPYIYEAIHSVLNQTFEKFEYIIVDDGSTDDTESVVRSFNDERIHYYKINHIGRSKALNYGLEKCNRDWIAIIDADDIWHPNKLEKQVKLIGSETDVIFTNSLFFKRKAIKFSVECPKSKERLMKILQLHGHMNNSSILYNRNLIKSVGGYDESFSNTEDYDLISRIIPKANYKYVDDYLVYSKLRTNSISSVSKEMTKKNIQMIHKKYFSNKVNGILDEAYINQEEYLDSWREYFYGDKKNARKLWLSNKKLFLKDYRIILAFIITYLPNSLFEKFLQSRFRLRIKYYLKKFMRDEKLLNSEKVFKSIIKDNLWIVLLKENVNSINHLF